MNRLFQLAAVAACVTCAFAQTPKMLVVLTVDQFRYDYLTKYRKEYNSGLARLLTKGAVYTNANYEHMPTVTAVGHSTIMSGASPALSGIVANEWYDRESGKSVSSVSDPKSKLLGADGEGSSPHRLMVSTVPDEIKMSGKGASKTIGISIKDRSAILPAGRMADAAYWFSNEAGVFVSSTWYQRELPPWVASHNAKKPGERYLGKGWSPLAGGAAMRTMPARPDTMFYTNLERSPYGNELLEEFAELAVDNEKLGTHPGVDVLSLSLSSNDYVGHAWGPDSPESHDMAVRTDRLLGKLFAYLDKKVGLANVLVVFTADHGVAPVPELNIERKMPGGRLKDKEYVAAVETALTAKFGGGKWVVSRGADLLFLDPKLVAANGAAAVRATAADSLRNLPHVFRVYTKEQIAAGQAGADVVGRRVANGHHVGRGPDVVMVNDPYWISGTVGTTHGAPFGYDTHVPLILMGPGVRPGRYNQSAAVNDLAPTVATILEVEVPSGSMGRVLHEALLQ